MYRFIGVCLLLLSAIDAQVCDQITCDNGGSCTNSVNQTCSCPAGWEGFSCALCTTSSVCNGAPCGENFPINIANRVWTCNVTEAAAISYLGSRTALQKCNANTGTCDVTLYKSTTGPPSLVHCSASGCSFSQTDTTVEASCTAVACTCNQPCDSAVQGVVDGMKTWYKHSCNRQTGVCVVTQAELPISVATSCSAQACGIAPPPPPPPPLSYGAIIGIAFAMIVVFFLLVALVAFLCVHVHKRHISPKTGEKEWTEGARPSSFTYTFDNLGFTIKNKQIISGISGRFESGTLVGIVGQSGAGKTTLLDMLALSKTTGQVTGEVAINDAAPPATFRYLTSYVVQKDCLPALLTVREHITFQAELKLPRTTKVAEIVGRVTRVIRQLRLEDVANSFIGNSRKRGISGGQMRRVSIACGLVTNPRIFLVDEPTSGLDAASSLLVMRLLRKYAVSRNALVVCSLHQPRSAIFHMIDKFMVVEKGSVYYQGPPSKLKKHLEKEGHNVPDNYNPADYVLDVIAKPEEGDDESLGAGTTDGLSRSPGYEASGFSDYGGSYDDEEEDEDEDEDEEQQEESSYGEDYPSGDYGSSEDLYDLQKPAAAADAKRKRPASASVTEEEEAASTPLTGYDFGDDAVGQRPHCLSQFLVLSRRMLLNLVRDPFLLRAHLITAVCVGLFLGGVYWKVGSDITGLQNRTGAFSFLIILFSFASLSSVDAFISERDIFARERADGQYYPISYFLSRTVFDLLPLRVFPALILGAIMYFMMGLRSDTAAPFFNFLLILTLMSITAGSQSLMVGTVSPNVSVGVLVTVLFLLIQLLFGGFVVNPSAAPPVLSWISKISFFYYAFEGFMVNELSGLFLNFAVVVQGFSAVNISGNTFLTIFGLNVSFFVQDAVILGAMAVIYLIVAFTLIQLFVKERR